MLLPQARLYQRLLAQISGSTSAAQPQPRGDMGIEN
jgi:hypothetical protein